MRNIIAISLLVCSCFTQQNYSYQQKNRPRNAFQNAFRNRRQDHRRRIDRLHNSLSQRFNELFQNRPSNRGVLRDSLRSNLRGNGDFKADPRFKNRLFGRGIHDKPVQIVPQINEKLKRFREVSIERNGRVVGRGFGQYHEGQLPVIVRSGASSARSFSQDNSSSSNSRPRRGGLSNRFQQQIVRGKSASLGSRAGIFSHRFKKYGVQNSRQGRNTEFSDPRQQSYVQVNIRQEEPDSNRGNRKSLYFNY